MREWLLILSIPTRLYTSVIPGNPENNGLQVSWATDLSPTALFTLAALPLHAPVAMPGAGRGVPGVGMLGGSGGAIPVPRPYRPGPHI